MGSVVVQIELDQSSEDNVAYCGNGREEYVGGTVIKQKRGLFISFQNVSYSIPVRWGSKITLLDGITGYFKPGQVTAVMGPSGSGKTTLLDVLAGRKTSGSLAGTIRYRGLPPSPTLLRRATGYVEQFDTLVDTLSCYEMLLYTAQLKRPRQESLANKQAAVEQLLGKLGLGSCASTQIGSNLKRGISGGQAKRLNIGIALITDPRVLFLDEPTSGLDSFTANEVMSVVAGLARDGTTIATTIHSPSSYCFGLFDKLLVLMSGRLVYLGEAGDAAIAYFTSSCGAREPRIGDNLAEWMLEAVTQAERGSCSCSSSNGSSDGSSSSSSSGNCSGSSLVCTYNQELAAKTQHDLGELLRQEEQRLTRSASRVELQQLSVMQKAGKTCNLQWGTSGSSSSSKSNSNSSWWISSSEAGPVWGSRTAAAAMGPNDSDQGVALDITGQAYVTPFWWGLKVLLQYRTWRNYCSPSYVLPRVMEKLVFAAVVLSLYLGKGTDFSTMNVPVLSSLLFLMVLAPICAAVLYLPSMMMERALFVRERSDGLYRPVTYLLFKLLDELVIMAPVTAVTTAAVFFACKLQGSYLLFWLVGYVTLANGTALSYFLASASPNMGVAMGVLPFLLCMALILCGFMIREPAMPRYWSWAVKLNVVHYSWGALMINQYNGHQASNLGGTGVLKYFGLSEDDGWLYVNIAVAFFFGWSVLAWLALAYARTHKR